LKNTKGVCPLTIIGDNQAHIRRFSSMLSMPDFGKVYLQLKKHNRDLSFQNISDLDSEQCSK